MTLVLNIIITVFILLFSIYKLKKDYKIFYLMLYIYYQALITSASVTYIEYGNYISEQGRFGYFVWANFWFLLFFLISVQVLEYGLKTFRKYTIRTPKFQISNFKFDYFITIFLAVIGLVLLLLNLLLSSSPHFDPSVTRFTYWENSKLSFLNNILGNTAVFIPFIFGILCRRNKFSGALLFILYIFYLLMIGQKFSPILRALYAFFMPIVLTSNLKNIKINFVKFLKLKYLIIIVLLFTPVYIKYSQHNPFKNYGADSVMGAIIYRAFGLQAHLYWGSVEQFVYLDKPNSWNLLELYKGMHTLMKYFWYGDLDHIEASMSRGFSFTNAYPGILLKIFPLFFSYLFHILLLFFIYVPSIWLLELSVKRNAYFLSFISFQCFNWVGVAFIMGYFNKVIPFLVVIILVLLFSYLISLTKKHQTNA